VTPLTSMILIEHPIPELVASHLGWPLFSLNVIATIRIRVYSKIPNPPIPRAGGQSFRLAALFDVDR